ncbi:hypothetical protein O9K51_06457 [Purpureocillium lavendulum]|uniref:Uncharacterized protein n=1 Tax=Purpureocillium lavendulum TaxID=1247861 RepID=A0AB34FNB3_9HYPO|nr:hypothetical protein O9K51_06457 [Purpureocillium lavendulum]
MSEMRCDPRVSLRELRYARHEWWLHERSSRRGMERDRWSKLGDDDDDDDDGAGSSSRPKTRQTQTNGAAIVNRAGLAGEEN